MKTKAKASTKFNPFGKAFRRPSKPAMKLMWSAYLADRTSIDARNRLASAYLPFVFDQAKRMADKLPAHVTPDDLMQVGTIGLLDAMSRFDPNHGNAFTTFCLMRVRGAMLDLIRDDDQTPRLARLRQARIAKATAAVADRNGGMAGDEEIASEMGIGLDELADLRAKAPNRSIVSMDNRAHGGQEHGDHTECRIGDAIPDPSPIPFDIAAQQDWWANAAKGLTRGESLLLSLYYRQGMTMAEIGRVLDLSESRVSQMHSSMVARMKARGPGAFALAA